MLTAFVPIWVLTGLGWWCGRRRLLGDQAERVLGGFVLHLAMPAALFTTLSHTRLAVHPPALGAFAASTVATMLLAHLAVRLRRRSNGEATIGAMAAGYVNSANLGIPVALQVLGDATFLTEVLLFQVLVVTPVILVLLDRDAGRPTRPGRLLTLPLRNPVIAGPALGALCSGLGWQPPEVVGAPLALLGAAAVPTALVALGLSLTADASRADRGPADHGPADHGPADRGPADRGPAYRGLAGSGPVDRGSAGGESGGRSRVDGGSRAGGAPGSRADVALLTGLKLVAQPLIAGLVGALAGVASDDLLALTVCAALPTAQNTYLFAQEYGRGVAVARRTVVVSTALSMATLAGIGAVLG